MPLKSFQYILLHNNAAKKIGRPYTLTVPPSPLIILLVSIKKNLKNTSTQKKTFNTSDL